MLRHECPSVGASGTSSADVTFDVIRMVERGKAREAMRYRCECSPIPPSDWARFEREYWHRSTKLGGETLGVRDKIQTVDARVYHGVDKPYI